MGAKLIVKNGGFVGNFNRSREIASPLEALLIRKSMLACTAQAVLSFRSSDIMSSPQRFMMDPRLQSWIALQWLHKVKGQLKYLYDDCWEEKFKDLDWIRRESCAVDSGGLVPFAGSKFKI